MQVELSPATRSFCSGRHSPLTGHGWAVRCRCRSLLAGERCAHTSPATHQPSPENSRDFPVLGAAVSQVWPAELTWSSRRAGRVADVRSPLQVCKDRPPIALRPPRARSHPFPSPSPRQLTCTRSPHAGTRAWSRADDAIGQGERARRSWGTLAAGSGCRRPPPPQMLTNGMHTRVTYVRLSRQHVNRSKR